MRYFLELSYRGTNYNGWQRQTNAPSVQQTVEQALTTILRENIEIIGAGRTDTGVHAAYYVAHFDTSSAITEPDAFCYHLNALLPFDIAVQRITPVTNDAHARFDAIQREYKYYILPTKNPFNRDMVWQYYVELDIVKMNSAAQLLCNYSDFTTFSKLHSNNKTSICKIHKSQWYNEQDMFIYTITADRFLRNMVRSIVGTLVDVGRGKLSLEQFEQVALSLDRSRASGSAPARGLFLTGIEYPIETFKTK